MEKITKPKINPRYKKIYEREVRLHFTILNWCMHDDLRYIYYHKIHEKVHDLALPIRTKINLTKEEIQFCEQKTITNLKPLILRHIRSMFDPTMVKKKKGLTYKDVKEDFSSKEFFTFINVVRASMHARFLCCRHCMQMKYKKQYTLYLSCANNPIKQEKFDKLSTKFVMILSKWIQIQMEETEFE